MSDAPHHLPLQRLAQRLQHGETIIVEEINAELENYILAMAAYSLIDVETWFNNILFQMAPICLLNPQAEDYTLQLLFDIWHQMGFENLNSIMESIQFMYGNCTDEEYDRHRKKWLESLLPRADFISRLLDDHPWFKSTDAD